MSASTQRHGGRDGGAEGDEQDQERDRQRELERSVEVVADEPVEILHDERVAERVHLEARVSVASAGEDRTEGRGLCRDGIRVALDRGHDPDARSVCRHEAGLGRGGIRIHQVGEDGLAGIVGHGAQCDRSCRRPRSGRRGPWRRRSALRTTR